MKSWGAFWKCPAFAVFGGVGFGIDFAGAMWKCPAFALFGAAPAVGGAFAEELPAVGGTGAGAFAACTGAGAFAGGGAFAVLLARKYSSPDYANTCRTLLEKLPFERLSA